VKAASNSKGEAEGNNKSGAHMTELPCAMTLAQTGTNEDVAKIFELGMCSRSDGRHVTI